jgi:small-conductance mechanosensitive channel
MTATWIRCRLPILLFLFAAAAGVGAETPSSVVQPIATGTSPATSAPLVLQNRTVFVFRAPAFGYSPEQRAAGAARRIQAVLAQGRSGALGSRRMSEGNLIQLGDAGLFLVTPADVNALAGESVDSVTEQTIHDLGVVLREEREQHDPQRLWLAAALAFVATLVYAAVLRLIVVGARWLAQRLGPLVQARAASLRVAGITPLHPAQLLGLARNTVKLVAWLLALLATYVWLTWTLQRFPYTRPWGEQLDGFFIDTLVNVVHAILSSLPGLVMVGVIALITRFLVQVARVFFHRVEAGHIQLGWLDADTAGPTRRIVTGVLWLFALAMAYPFLPGSHTDAFKGVSVLVGLMLSIGASSLVGQVASGLILIYSRALKVGEYVRIGDTKGTVSELGMFATHIDTGTGEKVILPNAFVTSNTTRNYSRAGQGHGFVLQVETTIGYSTPWRQVHAMLLEAARRTGGVLTSPPPYVIQTALSDFYVEYRLVACASPAAPAERVRTVSELNANVQDVFNEHGVQIMSPHYMVEPAQPQIVPKERWFAPPAQRPEG